MAGCLVVCYVGRVVGCQVVGLVIGKVVEQ